MGMKPHLPDTPCRRGHLADEGQTVYGLEMASPQVVPLEAPSAAALGYKEGAEEVGAPTVDHGSSGGVGCWFPLSSFCTLWTLSFEGEMRSTILNHNLVVQAHLGAGQQHKKVFWTFLVGPLRGLWDVCAHSELRLHVPATHGCP